MTQGGEVVIELPRELKRFAKIGVTKMSREDVILVDPVRRVVEVNNGFMLVDVTLPETEGMETVPPFLIPYTVIEEFFVGKSLLAADKVVVVANVGEDVSTYQLEIRNAGGTPRVMMAFEPLPYGEEHGAYPYEAHALIPDAGRTGGMVLGIETLAPVIETMKVTGSTAVRLVPGVFWSDPVRVEIGEAQTILTEPVATGALMQMWTKDGKR